MKKTKVIALFTCSILVSFALLGCANNESNKETINKDAISNEDNRESDDKEPIQMDDNTEMKDKDTIRNEGNTEANDKDTNGSEEDSKTVNEDANSNNKDSSDKVDVEDQKDKINQSGYDEFLKKENEEIIMCFSIADSDKVIAICESKDDPSYIVYRFGTANSVEFEFPEDSATSWDKFIYSYYLRGGSIENGALDLNYLTFEYDGIRYQIYQEYSAETDATEFGLRMTDIDTYEETIFKASEGSISGDLRVLRDYDKITIEVQ